MWLCTHLLFSSWHSWGSVPSPNLSSIICGLDLCYLIKGYTLPFILISLFYINLPFSTSFFLDIYRCVLLSPNLQNKPGKPSLDFILTSKYLSISLFFLTVKLPKSLVSRCYFYSSHSHVNHFTSVSLFLAVTESVCVCVCGVQLLATQKPGWWKGKFALFQVPETGGEGSRHLSKGWLPPHKQVGHELL